MKKHVYSLMMMLALVVLAGTSVFAQTAFPVATPALGSSSNPKVYITGATDSLMVTKGYAGSTLDWVLKVSGPAGANATGTDLDLVAHPTWTATQSNAAGENPYFRFKWTDTAQGTYYLEVTETAPAANGGCVTVRGFYIWIMGFDAVVYASNAAGDSLQLSVGADLAILESCGGGTYPVFMNELIENADGTDRSSGITSPSATEDLLNTTTHAIPTDGDLSTVHGTSLLAVRNYTVELHFDAAPVGASFSNPTVESIMTNIKVNLAADSVDIYSINGTVLTEAGGSSSDERINLISGSTYKYRFEVAFFDRWGTDLEPTVTVSDVTLFEGDAATPGLNLGEEPSAYEANPYYTNTSNAFKIFGKPATSIIKQAQ